MRRLVLFLRASSLRYKLLALVLIPLLLLTGTVILISATWFTSSTYEQLFAKVNTDLRVTHDVFRRIQLDRQSALTSLADSSVFLDLLESDKHADVLELLGSKSQTGGFDFINLLNPDGSKRLFSTGWQAATLHASPLSAMLFDLSTSERPLNASGIEIYAREDWQSEGGELADKVMFSLIETPFATPTSRTIEDRAMVIRVLQRVLGSDGSSLGVLDGGLLLNRNYAFVDEIRDLVYGPGSLAEGSRGTVTVFLDDVRITTNVPGSEDSRALGTRVSTEVRETVLGQGTTWIDRAFVVNDWYISAYEPIVDVNGKRVGMLYAGYLEAPFKRDLNRAIGLLAAVVLAGSLLAVVAVTLGAKSIFKPVEDIARVVRATARGERQRIGKLKSNDEIGELATQFDSMLDTLEAHRAHIEASAQQLEHKVQERTAELESKNTSLQESIKLVQETRAQLAMVEKLAAVGQLTAGVAHEINNPSAVILGNMDILIQELGDQRADVQTEIDLIIEQVYRIRSITDRLLQYSRPVGDAFLPTDEPSLNLDAQYANGLAVSPTAFAEVDINAVIADTLVLVRAELLQKRVQLVRNFGAVPPILIDKQELQQVLVNLIINAIESIAVGGSVEILTEVKNDDFVAIKISDNGIGIAQEHLQRVFDPFFTSGKEAGTGLGLSVSYGIVSRYGGHIRVSSEPGLGAVLIVELPSIAGTAAPTVQVAQNNAETVEPVH